MARHHSTFIRSLCIFARDLCMLGFLKLLQHHSQAGSTFVGAECGRA